MLYRYRMALGQNQDFIQFFPLYPEAFQFNYFNKFNSVNYYETRDWICQDEKQHNPSPEEANILAGDERSINT